MIWVMKSDSITMYSKMNSKNKLNMMLLKNFIHLITVITGIAVILISR